MKLLRQQFEQLFKENQLTLSLIGMSNIGKTYWSKKLSSIGFRHINCDDLIEAKLIPVLKKLKYSGIEDVSRWMGRPYDEMFPANQRKYLSLEREIMEDIFRQIKKRKRQNIVIDTTGSVVHTGSNIYTKLKQCSLVIYIEATKNMREEMFKQYIKKPKPVVFGEMFIQKKNETAEQALKKCYRALLDLRSTLYTKYADVIISRDAIEEDMDINKFISLIKQSL